MKATQVLIFLTFFFLYACKNTNSGESPETPGELADSILQEENISKGETYYAWVDKLRIREKPGTKSKVVTEIKEGEELIFLNEETDYTEKITLRKIQYNEPWLKVQSGDKIGWVYGGAIKKDKPRIDVSPSLYDPCFEKRAKGDYDDYLACEDAVMTKALKKDARFIEKTESGYTVTLLSGKTRTLQNDLSEAENYRKYEYLYYLERMGFFVFRVNLYEAGQYLLMDDKFGYSKPIQGFPKPSPDFKNIVISNADGVAGFEFNGIQILGFTDQGLEILFEKEFDIYEPHLPKWMDAQTIEFQLIPLSTDRHRKAKTAALKLKEDNSWALED